MPNLEELISKGTLFTDAHSTPLCAPSRYVLMSGNYQHCGRNQGGTWTLDDKGNAFEGQESLAHVLRTSHANYHRQENGILVV